ncbi:MAG: hypothetical protein ACE5GX_19155 [Thermoanaerobaculia bacterium]
MPARSVATAPAAEAIAAGRPRTDQAAVEDLEEQVFELDMRLLEAEGELVECRADLSEAREEMDKLEKLAQDVGNTAARAIADPAAQQRTPAAAPVVQTPPQRPRAYVRGYSGPYTTILGDEVVVDGKLWNGGNEGVQVTLSLELRAGDRRADSTTLSLYCGAGVDTPYRHVFRVRARDGVHYSTRIDIRQ